MMCLESEQELRKDLLLSLLFWNDEGMLGSMEIVSEVVDIGDTSALFIELFECLHNQIFPLLLHSASDSESELIKGDRAISVFIKLREQELGSFKVEIQVEENAGFSELIETQGLAFVLVQVVKKTDEFNISFRTSSLDRFSHFGLEREAGLLLIAYATESILIFEFDFFCGTLFLNILDVFLKVEVVDELINIDLINFAWVIERVNRVKIGK